MIPLTYALLSLLVLCAVLITAGAVHLERKRVPSQVIGGAILRVTLPTGERIVVEGYQGTSEENSYIREKISGIAQGYQSAITTHDNDASSQLSGVVSKSVHSQKPRIPRLAVQMLHGVLTKALNGWGSAAMAVIIIFLLSATIFTTTERPLHQLAFNNFTELDSPASQGPTETHPTSQSPSSSRIPNPLFGSVLATPGTVPGPVPASSVVATPDPTPGPLRLLGVTISAEPRTGTVTCDAQNMIVFTAVVRAEGAGTVSYSWRPDDRLGGVGDDGSMTFDQPGTQNAFFMVPVPRTSSSGEYLQGSVGFEITSPEDQHTIVNESFDLICQSTEPA